MRKLLLAALCGVVAPACGGPASPTPTRTEQTPAEGAEPTPAEPSVGETAAVHSSALTEEDERLLAADPATLSTEDRRKRAYALRKKMMQDPASPGARAIVEGAQAIERGELTVPEHLLRKEGEKPPPAPVLSAPPAGPEK